jgi:hypothetical protein
MSSVLDMIAGAGLLPHVYCKKVTLDRGSAEGTTDITLQLEIYQDKNALSESTWLNNLEGLGNSLMDALHLQVIPLKDKEHVSRLLASYNPTVSPGNVYTAKKHLGDGYLPRGKRFSGALQSFNEAKDLFPGGANEVQNEIPIKLSIGSLLGNLTQNGKLAAAREVIKNGKPYIVIPYEYKHAGVEISDPGDLGFLFYTFLDVAFYLSGSDIDIAGEIEDIAQDEEYLIEGSVNSVVVFRNGKVEEQREVFVQPSGEVWEGPVHLHTADNPAPNNYYGDGSFGDNKGWMVGETHKAAASQPRLSLVRVPNNLISDFRFGIFPEPLDTVLGLGSKTKVFNLGEGVAHVEEFLSPFQKEKRKDFIKDNDSEYSKLYISRDRNNNARGMFFINTRELLKNNSSLYPILFNESKDDVLANIEDIFSILLKSRILELKLYRDRVKKRVINTRYEKYANDKFYEEPSQLVGTISDMEGFQTPTVQASVAHETALFELTGVKTAYTSAASFTRYFMFHDLEVGEESAGLYRYRVELDFKDGTYEFLYELLRRLSFVKMRIDSYHELANSSFKAGTVTRNFTNEYVSSANEYVSAAYNKNIIKNYYQNGSFVGEFQSAAENLFSEDRPWNSAPNILADVQRIFGTLTREGHTVDFNNQTIKNMLSPAPGQSGSPQGINFFSRILGLAIKKIQSILDATSVNKSGSEIDQKSVPDGYTFNNFLDIVVSPSDCIIREDHIFDHPSELFKALSNEDIYVDYLSIGESKDSNFEGLRSLSPEFYVDRCKLDSVKFSPKAGMLENGVNGWLNYPFQLYGYGSDRASDSFVSTGYSYLTPSVVELSDPTVDDDSFKFYYTAFHPGARSHLYNTDSPLHSENFGDLPNYDRLFISLLNYSIKKRENDDADLSGASNYKISDPGNVFAGIMDNMETREAYKNLFDHINITVHDSQYYDSFFDRQPGAVSIDVPDKGEVENWQPSSYSDGVLQSHKYFKRALSSKKQNLIKAPFVTPSPYGYDTSLPSAFKLGIVRSSRLSGGNEEILQPVFVDAFNSSRPAPGLPDYTPTGEYDAFFFFNISLTAKIEVFLGVSGKFSKDDFGSWRPLTNVDLNLTEDEKLFCRISYYDQSLVRGMQLPTLDKYFLIYKAGDNPFVPPVIPTQPTDAGVSLGENATFWESQNQQSLNDFVTMINKGITSDGPPDAMPPYLEIYGPDLDPTTTSTALTTQVATLNIAAAAQVVEAISTTTTAGPTSTGVALDVGTATETEFGSSGPGTGTGGSGGPPTS